MTRIGEAIMMVLYPVGLTLLLIILSYFSPLLAISVTLFGLFLVAYLFMVER